MSAAKLASLATNKKVATRNASVRKEIEDLKGQKGSTAAYDKASGMKNGGMVKGKAKGYMCGGKVGKK